MLAARRLLGYNATVVPSALRAQVRNWQASASSGSKTNTATTAPGRCAGSSRTCCATRSSPWARSWPAILNNFFYSYIQVFIGRAFDLITAPGWTAPALLAVALTVVGVAVGQGLTGLVRNYAVEFLAQRIERDARDELYVSLLGKSQTFHGRQRIGDIMARATNDVRMLNLMFSPGLMLITRLGAWAIVVPVCPDRAARPRLLLVPVHLPRAAGHHACCDYNRRLKPVSIAMREQFGDDERRPGRGHRRHRGGQGQRPGALRVGQVHRQRPAVPRLLRAPGRDPGALPADAGLQPGLGRRPVCTACCSGGPAA